MPSLHDRLPPEAQACFPLFITVGISLDKIKKDNPLAVKIYDILGFTNADNVPHEYVAQFFPSETQAKVSESLALLDRYSLIRDFKTHISNHRQLQYVCVETLKVHDHLIPVMNFLVKQSTKILETQKGHAKYSDFVLNIHSIVKYLKDVPHEKDHTIFKILLSETIIMGNSISRSVSCYNSSALRILEDAYNETRKRLGMCDTECLRIQLLQAHGLISEREFGKAKELLEGLLTKQIQKFGEDHRYTLKAQYEMGRMYQFEENLDDAIELLSEIYEKQKKVLGEKDPDTKKSQARLELVLKEKETSVTE